MSPLLKNSGLIARLALLLALFALPSTVTAGEMKANWKNGLKFSDDSGNSVKIGGRIYTDWAWFDEDDDYVASAGSIADGTEFRTARLFMSGKMHEVVSYKVQLNFTGGSKGVEFKDVYMGLKKTPIFDMGLKVGQFKQPFGLDELTSSKYIMFMERSQTAGFAPSRQSGFQLGRSFHEEDVTFHASFFREVDKRGKDQSDGKYGVAARLTALPWTGEDNDLLHVGVSFARRPVMGGGVDLANEPEAHLQDEFSEIMIPATGVNLFDVEGAAVSGPFSVQGEFLLVSTIAPDGDEDGSFNSYYLQGSWFLTGESRQYKKSSGTFNRTKPAANYGSNGNGAVELAARWSSTDLNDGPYEGGTLDAFTAGANWYLNPNTRVMLNYVRSDGETPGGTTGITQALQARFQVDF